MIKKLIPLALAVTLIGYFVYSHQNSGANSSSSNTSQGQQIQQAAEFNKTARSTTDPASLWVVVNKQHPLPSAYVPADLTIPNVPLRSPGASEMQLRKDAAGALESMFGAAKKDNLNLMLSSGYRSYTLQSGLYSHYVKTEGQIAADRESARPGYSEHQTGWAADIEPTSGACDVQQCFGNLPEGKWLAKNAYKYGFIIRYVQGKESITGYRAEPWHIRYVGGDLASEMHQKAALTLEEFFGISGGTTYKS